MNTNQAKNQVKHILAIGTLCGLILATFLALGVRDSNRVVAQSLGATPALTTQFSAPQISTPQISTMPNDQAALESQLAALQAQNQALNAALQRSQAQLAQDEQQLTQAVQIIRQLQGQQQQAPSFR